MRKLFTSGLWTVQFHCFDTVWFQYEFCVYVCKWFVSCNVLKIKITYERLVFCCQWFAYCSILKGED